MTFSHTDQQKIWDEEHTKPTVLLQMDSEEASSGVAKFWEFLQQTNSGHLKGLEIGCGKGRNVIWLAKNGVDMYGFDFSPAAILEAKKRADHIKTANAHFDVQDATEKWKFDDDTFDIVIDCFASTDIESPEGRQFAVREMRRVLKPGGYLLAYLLSTDDEFHKAMIAESPSDQANAFHHPTGKFEKTFDEEELREIYKDFKIVRFERVAKKATFNGKEYGCKHFWLVLSK